MQSSRPATAPLTELPIEELPVTDTPARSEVAPVGAQAGRAAGSFTQPPGESAELLDPEAILLGNAAGAATTPRAAPSPPPGTLPAEQGLMGASPAPRAPGSAPRATVQSVPQSESAYVPLLAANVTEPEPRPASPPVAYPPEGTIPNAPAREPVPTVPARDGARAAPPATARDTGLRDSRSTPSAGAAASSAQSSASPPMDRDFIARNQIIERYLSGRLPLKGATDFERFCRENPQLLDELGLPERVHAGLRLLEASGKPEPWQEPTRPKWQSPQVVLGTAATALVLALSLVFVASNSASKTQRLQKLQRQLVEQPLEAATNTRAVRLVPSREGASNTPAIGIGRSPAQLVDLRIDETRSPYKMFQITIDRIDQGRVAVLHNLAKDSNGHLRLALNSSALGPGSYQLTIQGLSWRGDPEPDSWVTIAVQP